MGSRKNSLSALIRKTALLPGKPAAGVKMMGKNEGRTERNEGSLGVSSGRSPAPATRKNSTLIRHQSHSLSQIFQMTDQFELLGTAEFGEDVYATPAFVGEKIFVRGITHLFCVRERE